MTLPASGTITIQQIAAEFGLAATAVFPGAFYGKGGAPASGTLSFADFYGRSGASVVVGNQVPSSQSLEGTLGSCTFSPSSVSVTGAGSVTYTWSIVSPSGGTWTINSGQGTSTASARVTGLTVGQTRSATLRCTIVANGVTYTRDSSLSYGRTDGGGTTMTL